MHSATRVACIAFTWKGCALMKRIAASLGGFAGAALRPSEPEDSAVSEDGFAATVVSMAGPARFANEFGIDDYGSLAAWVAGNFASTDALLFVGATGIAVRAIAPHVRDKLVDPAVVSVDEAGRFAVPLLSGHVGGANELARAVARATGGQAAVSTATDVNGLFAVDEWAARRGFSIVERTVAKQVSARLLEGGSVGFASDFDLGWDPPAGVVACDASACGIVTRETGADVPDLGFAVTFDETSHPFATTLHLVPCAVTVGVGCRRGTAPAVLQAAVDVALADARVSPRAVAALASIDVKADEPAILELARARGWQARFYTADELASVPGSFAASDFVKRTVGVDNVCERAALAEGGRLILGKRPGNGVTVALGSTM